MSDEATILHADLDSFYASVEQRDDPRLRGRPVIVGPGVVLAASYEAKAHGVRTAMGASKARRLCPQAVVVRARFEAYSEASKAVFQIFDDTTPLVEGLSIDEAFLDVSGTTHLLGNPSHIARVIRRRVRQEVGLPISVGLASTKFLAKIASARAKPDGMVMVEPGTELDFLHPLPVEALWGVGKVTAGRLHRLGVATVGELAEISSAALTPLLGPAAAAGLRALSWNLDPRRVRGGRRAGSVGSQQALGAGLVDRDAMAVVVLGLADRVGRRLRAKDRVGTTITVRMRLPGPRSVTRSHTLAAPTASTAALADLGMVLVDRARDDNPGETVTLIGLSVSNLTTETHRQLEFDLGDGDVLRSGSDAALARTELETSVDRVREKFGRSMLTFGTGPGGLGDDFRRLSEKS